MSDTSALELQVIHERLERLETTEAARAAAYRYAQAIDTPDFEMLAEVFAPEASLTTRRGTRHSRDAIVEYYREALADRQAAYADNDLVAAAEADQRMLDAVERALAALGS